MQHLHNQVLRLVRTLSNGGHVARLGTFPFGILALLLFTVACGRLQDHEPGPPLSPALLISGPQGEELVGDVSGVIVLSITPTLGVREVEFRFAAGSRPVVVSEAPFSLSFDTRKVANGRLTVEASVRYDAMAGTLETQRDFDVSNPGSGHPIDDEPPAPDDPQHPPHPQEPGPPVASHPLLTWAPPPLSDFATIGVPENGGVLNLDPGRDYRIIMPDRPVMGGVTIRGGRNVVMIGGEIEIPMQPGTGLPESARRGLLIKDNVGTVHVEGLYIHGEDLGEGIQISAKDSIVQLQNVRIWGIHARDQVNFSDGHPDLIQTWGNVGQLRVDKLTGKTDYQGFFFKADMNGRHGDVDIRRANIHGDVTARYLFWMSDAGGGYPQVTLDELYVQPAPGRSFGRTIWPDVANISDPATVRFDAGVGTEVASWASLPVSGVVTSGQPATGDFVPEDAVGIGYRSPGYL